MPEGFHSHEIVLNHAIYLILLPHIVHVLPKLLFHVTNVPPKLLFHVVNVPSKLLPHVVHVPPKYYPGMGLGSSEDWTDMDLRGKLGRNMDNMNSGVLQGNITETIDKYIAILLAPDVK